ncbi:hypothetical protein BASA81_008696 [Batrachochytrium salamandrivorans]|nr:hypothetical protein BASA81_008696 [Batrachochytrium salamandrivorans]
MLVVVAKRFLSAAPAISPLHFALMDKIAKSKTSEQIDKLVELAPNSMLNAGTCAAALRRLGVLQSAHPHTIAKLLSCTEPIKLKPAQLRDCVFGLAQLRETLPESLVDKTLQCKELGEFTGEDFALLLDSLPEKGGKSLMVCDKLAAELCERKNLKDFEGRHLGSIAHDLAVRFELVDHPVLASIARDIVKRKTLSDFESDDFGLILKTYASLPVKDEMLFDKVNKFLCKYPETLDEFEAVDFGVVLQSFVDAGFDHTRLFGKVVDHLLLRPALDNFTGYDIALIMQLLDDYDVCVKFSEEIVNREPGGGLDEFEIEEIASILATLAGFKEPNMLALRALFNSVLKRDLTGVNSTLLESIYDNLESLGFPVDSSTPSSSQVD